MLLRDHVAGDAEPRLEVLLLRRSSDTPFVPGAHVFPGGAVDDGDADPGWDDHTDVDDERGSAALGLETGGRAYWIAAMRECLEEAGVLVATADGETIDDSHPVLADEDGLRQDLERGTVDFLDLCRSHGLHLPISRMAYVSQWITPEESPRRYDARFFAVSMPAGQSASADEWEAVEARWWSPADALDSWQAGQIELIEPTVESLRLLAGFASTDEAMAALRSVGERTP